MEIFPEFMQRPLELQIAGRQRSPEPILEDERLMDGLQKRILTEKPVQTLQAGEDDRERARFKAQLFRFMRVGCDLEALDLPPVVPNEKAQPRL
jgi:hypothetical protein